MEDLKLDGVVIVTEMYSREHVEQVKQDLAPYFAADVGDQSGFFPKTTQRSTCVFYRGSEKITAVSKPIISSTVGFRVNPGGKQQGLHRDDTDFHARPCD